MVHRIDLLPILQRLDKKVFRASIIITIVYIRKLYNMFQDIMRYHSFLEFNLNIYWGLTTLTYTSDMAVAKHIEGYRALLQGRIQHWGLGRAIDGGRLGGLGAKENFSKPRPSNSLRTWVTPLLVYLIDLTLHHLADHLHAFSTRNLKMKLNSLSEH